MNILGVNTSHDAAAAISKNGELIFAAAEERFSRIKQDSVFPYAAIIAALEFAGLQDDEIDLVAFGWPRPSRYIRHDLSLLIRGVTPPTFSRFVNLASSGLDALRSRGGISDYLRVFNPPKQGFRFYDHHFCHASSAYFASGYDESAIIVFDGRGAFESTSLWHGKGDQIELLECFDFPDSIGFFFAEATELLGFTRASDEWKVMGLASYGEPSVDLSEFIQIEPRGYRVQGSRLFNRSQGGKSRFAAKFASFARQPHEEIRQIHKDFAASIQRVCEEAMQSVLRRVINWTKSRRICLAGGVALNCKGNGELLRSGAVDEMFVQPAAGDDGVSIGAAFAAHREFCDTQIVPQRDAYLGPSYSDADIQEQLRVWKAPFIHIDRPGITAARLLANGNLIGWFQGRMEFGPRALGARSILADPTHEENRDKVNAAVKFREHWRPFAPSVLHSEGATYFKDYCHSPYMNVSFWATTIAKAKVPAIVHVDGSSRVQSVTPSSNPDYAELLMQMKLLTGAGVVLNTSFNLKGEPIVCTPYDAIRTFYTSGLDALIIGRFLISKNPP